MQMKTNNNKNADKTNTDMQMKTDNQRNTDKNQL